MDRGAWRARVHRVAKCQTQLNEHTHTHTHTTLVRASYTCRKFANWELKLI